ncbi:MAG: VPDSG-CTERM sorting domain-containing protein [Opitutales bacterium]|jgi:hypothetical protein|nr:VPDSG-CTERM sorting domain-containing protein [Opitutales bacterium]MDG2254122.1 VPDSG-CTERM sorting domain-containing protein [Opitutaceae bacterium]
MKSRILALILSLAFGTTGHSAIITYIYQDGDDVRVYATGTVNLNAFGTILNRELSNSYYDDSLLDFSTIYNITNGPYLYAWPDAYTGDSILGPFGATYRGTHSGDKFGFQLNPDGYLLLDENYVSGSQINSYAVYNNILLSNMDIFQTNMSGTFTSDGVSETVNILVGTAPPVPDTGSTAALLGVGVVILAVARRRLG